jgi:peptidoglycan hydrolase CwlO-like protein
MMKKLTQVGQEELAALRAKVAHRREYLGILEMELFNTRAALQEFTAEYNARLGDLEAEYQRLESLMDAAFEEEEAARQKPGASPNGRAYSKKARGSHRQRPRHKASRLPRAKDPEYERKIRELFRNLAKRFHPDLASEPDEKEQREQIMAKINAAYTARDLGALESLAKDYAAQVNGNSGEPAAEFAHLKVELRHLEAMIFELEHTIRELDLSPAWQLRSEVNSERLAGRDMLGDMELNIKERIAELREHLLDLGVEPELVNA